MDTEELEKISANSKESHTIGEFLEWLKGKHEVTLCRYSGRDESLYPVGEGIEELLAHYFGVDLVKAEKERQGLLDEIRAKNS